MKPLKLFVFLIFGLLACVNFTSCSDDDDKDAPVNSATSLIGTWVNTDYDDEDGTSIITMTFLKNGKGIVSAEFEFDPEENFTHPFTWSLKGDLDSSAELTIEGVDADSEEYSSWTYQAQIVDNILFLTDVDDDGNIEITDWVKMKK